MPRPRIVHGLSRIVDRPLEVPERSLAPAPLGAAPTPGRVGAGSGPPDIVPVSGRAPICGVRMENIHPLRLRILLAINRTGSISAAAELCGIGQPSASMHLRTLEGAIGHRLVTRTGRGSRLTGAGKLVAAHAAEVLATLDSMQWALDALDGRVGGELTVAASLAPSVALIPPILRRFSDLYPGVSVKLRTAPSETVVQEVARAGADVGIAGEVASTEPVVRNQILLDELVGIAPVGLFGTDAVVSRGELARNSLVLGSEGSSTRAVTERYLTRAKYRPARIWAFDSYEAIKHAVMDGIGVSFISRLLVADEIRRGELAVFHLADVETMVRPIDTVRSSMTELTTQAAAFISLLLDANRAAYTEGQLA